MSDLIYDLVVNEAIPQNIIKENDFKLYLGFLLTPENIHIFNEAHKALHDSQIFNLNEKIVDTNLLRNLFLLLYFEAISTTDLLSFITELTTQPGVGSSETMEQKQNRLMELVTACIQNYFGTGASNTISAFKKYLMRDLIVDLPYGYIDDISYKNIDNIKSEFNRIWQSLSNNERSMVSTIASNYNVGNSDEISTSVGPDNFYKLFSRINGHSALIEDCMGEFSWALNYEYSNVGRDTMPSQLIAQKDYSLTYNSTTKNTLLSLLKKISEATIHY